jgi:transketolase
MPEVTEKRSQAPSQPRPVLVVGSCNYDLVIQSQRLPGPAETILGGDYRASPGGKGANQAVGLRRLGTPVRFLSRVGNDHYGEQILAHLAREGIDTSHIGTDEDLPTGLALITLGADSTRSIVVSPGANRRLLDNNVEAFIEKSQPGGILVTQLEIPAATVVHLLQLAKRHDQLTVLHASPAVQDFAQDALRLVDVLVLNQSELRELSGRPAQHMETAAAAAEQLVACGCGVVLVSMGTRGVLIVRKERSAKSNLFDTTFVSGIKVTVEDSNVGSSAFIAGLVHHLARAAVGDVADNDAGDANEIDLIAAETLVPAVKYGLGALALSLSRAGGQASLASAEEVQQFVERSASEPGESGLPRAKKKALEQHARSIRRRIIRMLSAARSGHPGGSLSLVEILTALYYHAMVYNPKRPSWPARDRLVLSKGHAAPALYCTLIEAGYLDESLETELRKLDSPLQGHPDMRKCPGVEMSTGSLGQGLSAANGMALGARHQKQGYRVYCILGDGEVQEGQIWEAAMSAAHCRLDNLCAILDYNALQIDGSIGQVKSPIEPLADKWRAFGWRVFNVDGHDLVDLCAAFDQARELEGQPTILIAQTIKGRGVSFMEGVIEYHGSTLSEKEAERALEELSEVL